MFPIPKNPRLQKISRFEELFENLIFLPNGNQGGKKFELFKKFSKSADFLYSGVFRYGEHESEEIFWPLEGTTTSGILPTTVFSL